MIGCISKTLEKKHNLFGRFFSRFGFPNRTKIEQTSIKMVMLAPRWVVLGGFGVMLHHFGNKIGTRSARMSQHRRQGANPRGFEDLDKAQDGMVANPQVQRQVKVQSSGTEPWEVGAYGVFFARGVVRIRF